MASQLGEDLRSISDDTGVPSIRLLSLVSEESEATLTFSIEREPIVASVVIRLLRSHIPDAELVAEAQKKLSLLFERVADEIREWGDRARPAD